MYTKDFENVIERCNKAFDELYIINSLVNLIKTSCEDKEFKGKYYDAPLNIAKLLSDERNDYINALTLLSDRLSCLYKQCLIIEDNLTLHNDTNDSSR